jgi:cytochrome o ubiquinol oxidase operon protein cyoD
MSLSRQSPEQGTVKSYIIGFILSLLFTAIPYMIVTGKTVTGSPLLVIILGFAFLQMAVQIFFFLHLGRGPKPLYNVGFFVGTFFAILVVVVGSVFIMDHLHQNMSPTETKLSLAEGEAISQINGQKTGACKGIHPNHRITFASSLATPGYVEARRCDTLTFINQDEKPRDITFGTHPQHSAYSGQSDLQLRAGRGKTITLNLQGSFEFHDHLDPNVSGSFVVNP